MSSVHADGVVGGDKEDNEHGGAFGRVDVHFGVEAEECGDHEDAASDAECSAEEPDASANGQHSEYKNEGFHVICGSQGWLDEIVWGSVPVQFPDYKFEVYGWLNLRVCGVFGKMDGSRAGLTDKEFV